ncbi:MAG: DUF4388 domain-containing protein [Sandaracinaceae bacterium]
MGEPSDLVVIDQDGSVRVAGRAAERRLRDRAGRYRLVVDTPGMVVLRHEETVGDEVTRIAMAGELLTRTSVLEIVNIVANANWRGVLHVFDGECHRVLAVDQGAIKYALSDHPDDRLGQVMYGHGLLTRAELDRLLMEVGPEKRLGQLVLDQNVLTQEELYGQLQKQVEQIVFSTLLTREGHYIFTTPEEEAPPHHTVHLPINALLMEGVQRIDEMALFRERIPHDDLCPIAQPKATSLTLDENANVILAYADGVRTIEDISRETGLGQFKTVKSIYGLVQQGGVLLKPKRTIDARAVKKLVIQFNDVLRDIFMAVATYGGIDQTRSTLETWIAGSGYDTVFGDTLYEDGSLPAAEVAQAMQSVDADNPMEALHQALHELAAFALFAATTTLPRDQELSLSRDVNARLKRIRA